MSPVQAGEKLLARQWNYERGSGSSARTVTLNQGDAIPDDVPSKTLEAMRRMGAVGTVLPGDQADRRAALDAVAEAPEGDAGGRPGAPDVTDTVALAAYIDEHSLNAEDTVALAGGDAAKAPAVLEAEKTAHGGDPRKTVAEPLEKLAKSGGGN